MRTVTTLNLKSRHVGLLMVVYITYDLSFSALHRLRGAYDRDSCVEHLYRRYRNKFVQIVIIQSVCKYTNQCVFLTALYPPRVLKTWK